MSPAGFASRFGANPFSLGARIVAVVVWGADVFHLSEVEAMVVSTPGTALGALGVRWAITKGQKRWFSWTAFGLNFVVTLLGFIALIAYLVFGDSGIR